MPKGEGDVVVLNVSCCVVVMVGMMVVILVVECVVVWVEKMVNLGELSCFHWALSCTKMTITPSFLGV